MNAAALLLLTALAAQTPPVQILPPTALKLTVVAMDSTSLQLEWRAGGTNDFFGPPIPLVEIDIAWSTTTPLPTDPDVEPDAWFDAAEHLPNPPLPGPAFAMETLVVTGLTPGVVHHFAIRGSTMGDGSWLWVDRYTDAEDPDVGYASASPAPDGGAPGGIADLRAESFGSSSVTLAWTATGDDGSLGLAAAYDLRISRESPASFATLQDWFAQADPVPSAPPPGTGSEHAVVGALSPASPYFVAIRALDEVGLPGPLVNTTAFTVPEFLPESEASSLCGGSSTAGFGIAAAIALLLAAARTT